VPGSGGGLERGNCGCGRRRNSGRDNSQGTHGYGTISAPGNDPYVITVGAMKTEGIPSRSDDLIASYSSKGPTSTDHVVKPDLVAPGKGGLTLHSRPSDVQLIINPEKTHHSGPSQRSRCVTKGCRFVLRSELTLADSLASEDQC